ncbi:hypothetical protein SAMD00023353_4400370 [Rosellinia necatrix]|uniref:Uncharacterized protein n=1 Tax=Rosellinia necatrix TaxID=77044 RepID=A0A1W2TNI3_ROSNE|nr:hypothetical protein SAMD00023353_4400370 [Rosellinia necatrix]
MSNSSDVSPLSSPDFRPDDIVFSARPSPGLPADNSHSPRSSPQRYLRSSSARSSPHSSNADDASSPLARSQPIAIELPAPKKFNSAPVYTPPAPLSARGDLPGGYFPLHEEQSRVYRPHPFQLDATKARLKSIQRAAKGSSSSSQASSRAVTKSDMGPATTNLPPAKADRAMEIPQLNVNSLARNEATSVSTTPVASYMPLGDRSSPLPMGKYYPSNYERRKDEKRGKTRRPATFEPGTSPSAKSELQVPAINQVSNMSHSRNESEAKRRLQQYQRDMIAQATIALNRGNANEAAMGTMRPLGFTSMIKPSKPRLAPLGSPGPVTPMELEGPDNGYLGVHGGPGTQTELARTRTDEGLRREDSPGVLEFGHSTL